MPPEKTTKELVEDINTDFDKFKKVIDERLKLVEEGKAVPADLDEKIVKLEKSMSDQEELKDRIDVIETAAKRGNSGGQNKADEVKEADAEYSELIQKYMRSGDEAKGGIDSKDAARMGELHKILGEAKLLSIQSDHILIKSCENLAKGVPTYIWEEPYHELVVVDLLLVLWFQIVKEQLTPLWTLAFIKRKPALQELQTCTYPLLSIYDDDGGGSFLVNYLLPKCFHVEAYGGFHVG